MPSHVSLFAVKERAGWFVFLRLLVIVVAAVAVADEAMIMMMDDSD